MNYGERGSKSQHTTILGSICSSAMFGEIDNSSVVPDKASLSVHSSAWLVKSDVSGSVMRRALRIPGTNSFICIAHCYLSVVIFY